MTDVLVLAEGQRNGPLRNTLELLGAARRLADTSGGTVRVAVLGASPGELTASLFAHGAD